MATYSNMMMGYADGLGKQIFAKNVLGNGLFCSESSFVLSIIEHKIEWKYNDRFEYRMYFGGVANESTYTSALVHENGRPILGTVEEIGKFWARYGVLMANQEVDMFQNLETREKEAAFQAVYSLKIHGMRMQVGSSFRTILSHGQYMPYHRWMPPVIDERGYLKYIPRVDLTDDTGAVIASVDLVLFGPDRLNARTDNICEYVAYTCRGPDGYTDRDTFSDNYNASGGAGGPGTNYFIDTGYGPITPVTVTANQRLSVPPGSFWSLGKAVGPSATGSYDFSTATGTTFNATQTPIALPTCRLNPGSVFTLETPTNVFATNIKTGTLMLKASHEYTQIRASYDTNGLGDPNLPGAALPSVTNTVLTPIPGGVTHPKFGATAPWGLCFGGEMYAVIENDNANFKFAYIGAPLDVQPGYNDFMTQGRLPLPMWFVGDYFIHARNRMPPSNASAFWERFELIKSDGAGDPRFTETREGGRNIDVRTWRWKLKGSVAWSYAANGLTLTNDISASNTTYPPAVVMTETVGAMEGFPDLIPTYTVYGASSTNTKNQRLGLNRFFRGSAHRMTHTPEQAGWLYVQGATESPADTLLRACTHIVTTVGDIGKCCICMTEVAKQAMGQYERAHGANGMGLVTVNAKTDIKPGFIYQRGVTGAVYKVGDTEIPVAMIDNGIFSDCIFIMPKGGILYNSRDNTFLQIRKYMSKTFGHKKELPPYANVTVPKEIVTKLDLSQKFVVGNPYMSDMRAVAATAWDNQWSNWAGNNMVTPSVRIPLTYMEMGALYIDKPFHFAVVKLANQMINPNDMLGMMWNQADQSEYVQNFPYDRFN